MNTLRIATWNLNCLPPNGPRADACQRLIADVKANIWVFTEIRQGFKPGKDLRRVAESKVATDRKTEERWVSIWVDASIQGAEKNSGDMERTALARLVLPGEQVINVYGTVLPWVGSKWRGISGAEGEAYREALALQKQDWSALRSMHPEEWLCVAGDFNQEYFPPKHYYGSTRQQDALKEAFEIVNMACLTGGKHDPVARFNPGKANIDHICLGREKLAEGVFAFKSDAWSLEHEGTRVSDHHGVVVEFPLA